MSIPPHGQPRTIRPASPALPSCPECLGLSTAAPARRQRPNRLTLSRISAPGCSAIGAPS